jgi:hypothetical protein
MNLQKTTPSSDIKGAIRKLNKHNLNQVHLYVFSKEDAAQAHAYIELNYASTYTAEAHTEMGLSYLLITIR